MRRRGSAARRPGRRRAHRAGRPPATLGLALALALWWGGSAAGQAGGARAATAIRQSLALVCRSADSTCSGRCLIPRPGGLVGYCTRACDRTPCPEGWRCTGASGGRRVCARGPRIERDLEAQFQRRFPGRRADLARRWYRWYLKSAGAEEAELMAQIFLVSGLVAYPSQGRRWEKRFLEDVLFFVRLFPDAFLGTRYARLIRRPVRDSAGRTVPLRGAIEVHDANYGVYGTFLHEMGHVLDDLLNGGLQVEPRWRRLHGWRRDRTRPTGWRKTGRDCTSGYGVIYGMPGQEFADEQWNYVRYGCSFRKCSPTYYDYLKQRVWRGWCFCSKDPTCRNANPFQ